MAYAIGYLGTYLLIAFCIVQFILKKKYKKKNNEEMKALGVIIRTILIGLALLILSTISK